MALELRAAVFRLVTAAPPELPETELDRRDGPEDMAPLPAAELELFGLAVAAAARRR